MLTLREAEVDSFVLANDGETHEAFSGAFGRGNAFCSGNGDSILWR
jgi:hypothetical protein